MNVISDTPYRPGVFERFGRVNSQADVIAACSTARRVSGAAYSGSYFVPQEGGLGMEVIDMCLPIMASGQLAGHLVATYALQGVLSELVNKNGNLTCARKAGSTTDCQLVCEESLHAFSVLSVSSVVKFFCICQDTVAHPN